MCSNVIIHLSRKFYGPSCYNKNVQICPKNFCPLFSFAPMHKNPKFFVIVGSSTIIIIGFIIFKVLSYIQSDDHKIFGKNCQNFLISANMKSPMTKTSPIKYPFLKKSIFFSKGVNSSQNLVSSNIIKFRGNYECTFERIGLLSVEKFDFEIWAEMIPKMLIFCPFFLKF